MRLACIIAVCVPMQALAQAASPPAPETQRGGTFHEPPASVDAAYLPLARTASSPDGPAKGDVPSPLQATLSLDVPLRHGGGVGFASQGAHATSPTLQADLRWQPVAGEPWFARAVFYKYLQPGEQQPWNPDFFYSFGYDDYRPGTWSLIYANYTGTRFHPDAALNEGHFNFDQGVWLLAYRFELPGAMRPVFLVGDGDSALCRAGGELTPRFVDLSTASYQHNRTALTLGCRYTRPEGWFAEATAYAYPQGRKQQPWDPDFTYAFGYADWRAGTLSLQYGNYSGNRWPGRSRGAGEGELSSGSITLSWRLDW